MLADRHGHARMIRAASFLRDREGAARLSVQGSYTNFNRVHNALMALCNALKSMRHSMCDAPHFIKTVHRL